MKPDSDNQSTEHGFSLNKNEVAFLLVLIEQSCLRGAVKAGEMTDTGIMYQRLVEIYNEMAKQVS